MTEINPTNFFFEALLPLQSTGKQNKLFSKRIKTGIAAFEALPLSQKTGIAASVALFFFVLSCYLHAFGLHPSLQAPEEDIYVLLEKSNTQNKIDIVTNANIFMQLFFMSATCKISNSYLLSIWAACRAPESSTFASALATALATLLATCLPLLLDWVAAFALPCATAFRGVGGSPMLLNICLCKTNI